MAVDGYLGCGVSFSRDTQNPPGHGPMQPALGDPALAGVIGLGDPQTSLPTLTILRFCDQSSRT